MVQVHPVHAGVETPDPRHRPTDRRPGVESETELIRGCRNRPTACPAADIRPVAVLPLKPVMTLGAQTTSRLRL